MTFSRIHLLCFSLVFLSQHVVLEAARTPKKTRQHPKKTRQQKDYEIKQSLLKIYGKEPIDKTLSSLKEKAKPAGERPLVPINGTDTAAKVRLVEKAKKVLEKHGELVQIDKAAIRKEIEEFKKSKSEWEQPPNWNFELPQALQSENSARLLDIANFLFVLNSTNYRYWFDSPAKNYPAWEQGSFSASEKLSRLYSAGRLPGLHLRPEEVKDYLRSAYMGMPAPNDRLNRLEAAADIEKFEKHLASAFKDGRWHFDTQFARDLAQLYPKVFGNDPFLKRSQLTTSMIAAVFYHRGEKVDLSVTAFADYRVPQLLRHMGILKYSTDLGKKVDNQEKLLSGKAEEVSIRAATIVAANMIAKELGTTDANVDAALFLLTRDPDFKEKAKPHHRTVTANY